MLFNICRPSQAKHSPAFPDCNRVTELLLLLPDEASKTSLPFFTCNRPALQGKNPT
jgi:hypothetical protein